MWKPFFIFILAALTTLVQISFLSQLPFPFSALSIPLVAIAYGVVRGRPLLSVGWALVAGVLLDLYGLLGFGAELAAFFIAFFVIRFLFLKVVTNTGTLAIFLLGAATAIVHWFILSAIDGVSVLFGGMPVLTDLSLTAAFAPVRQALVCGLTLILCVGIEETFSRRYRKIFLSHAAPHAFS